jgi:hypothetical protein
MALRIGIWIKKAIYDEKLEYFRKKILDHLSKLEKEETEAVNKTIALVEALIKGGYAVGTIRTWGGKGYVKVAPGDWRPKYDSQTRGAKMAISAIKKRVAAAKDEHEMMQIILANRDRFNDNEGHPLPFVQELHNYIEEQKTARTEKPKEPISGKPVARQSKPGNRDVKIMSDQEIHDELIEIAMKHETDSDWAKKVAAERSKREYQRKINVSVPHHLKPVKYDGEYVLAKNGKKDFGEIKAETGLPEGKIRLRTGKQTDKKGDFGEKHIERPERLAQLKQNGYQNARDFVEDVAQNYEAIYKGRGNGIILTKKGENRDTTLFVELMPNDESDFYDVKSGLISKKGYTKNKTPIWEKPQNGAKTGPERAPTNQRDNTSLRVNSGSPDTTNIPKSKEKSSGNKWIDKVAAMSYEEFDKLPDKDKMTYNYWVRREYDKIVKHYEGMEDKKDIEAILTQKLQEFTKRYGKEPSRAAKKSDFEKIQERYQSAASVTGDEDEIQIGKDPIPGVWKLVEADTPTPSHDETTFHKTPGFPAGKDGSTINDRDYGHDKAAQEAVISIGADFDGRALKVDDPVIVTKDGIVISGNNRTMSSKIAARKGTDAEYIEALKKRAKKFGFTGDQINQFKHPRVVFEVENSGEYSTEQFAQFNQSGKKEMGPTEKAVKVSKLIKPETVEAIAKKISEFDTLGELYADRSAVQHIFSTFKESGLIGENETGKYLEGGAITDDGKAFVETALLGSVMNENNIRGFNRPGCKSIRATLVRAITPLIENKGLNGYSINRELNEAVDIAMQVAINRDKFKSVDEFSRQGSMFETLDPVALELAKKLEGTQKTFAEFMQKMNGGLKYAASGEADIFLGGVESKDDIIGRFMNIKKAVLAVLQSIPTPALIKSLVNLGKEESA